MKRIYFIRHGESELNVAKLWAGHTDTPLTENGREQARKAGKKMKLDKLSFDIIVSSPLKRALHTAQHVAEHIDYPVDKIVLHEGLKERNFGALEEKDITLHFNIPLDKYLADPYAIDHLEEVEKVEALHNRARALIQEMLDRPEESILLVSHGAFGRALQRAVKNAPLHEHIDPIPNAHIIRLV
jgi:broad specificity phosphatase PhoE